MTGISPYVVSSLISSLHHKFALKDFHPLYYFLGIEAVWHKDSILHLSHTKYIDELLYRANIHEAKPQSTLGVCITSHAR